MNKEEKEPDIQCLQSTTPIRRIGFMKITQLNQLQHVITGIAVLYISILLNDTIYHVSFVGPIEKKRQSLFLDCKPV